MKVQDILNAMTDDILDAEQADRDAYEAFRRDFVGPPTLLDYRVAWDSFLNPLALARVSEQRICDYTGRKHSGPWHRTPAGEDQYQAEQRANRNAGEAWGAI